MGGVLSAIERSRADPTYFRLFSGNRRRRGLRMPDDDGGDRHIFFRKLECRFPLGRPEPGLRETVSFGEVARMVKRLLFVAMLGSALVTTMSVITAQAADPAFCRDYARAALNQVRIALATPSCRAGLQGARWSADFRVHFDWCVGASYPAVQSERGARTGYIRACRGM
jgi:hypothetical protein